MYCQSILWKQSLSVKVVVSGAVVVAQLVERSLTTSEIRGSNPNISKFYLPIVHLNRKDGNKENEAGKGPSFEVNVSC